MHRLLKLQFILIGLLVLGLAVLVGTEAFRAALFGGIIALMNTGLMILHERRAAHRADNDAQRILKYLYLCVVERLVLTLVLFVVGLVALKLMPLYLLTGFITGQLAAFLNGLSH